MYARTLQSQGFFWVSAWSSFALVSMLCVGAETQGADKGGLQDKALQLGSPAAGLGRADWRGGPSQHLPPRWWALIPLLLILINPAMYFRGLILIPYANHPPAPSSEPCKLYTHEILYTPVQPCWTIVCINLLSVPSSTPCDGLRDACTKEMSRASTLAGKLFPGPHLYAGAAIVVLWAGAASLVPAMTKGNEVARTAHITLNSLNLLLFAWQVCSRVPAAS